jgi:hypothetical protein
LKIKFSLFSDELDDTISLKLLEYLDSIKIWSEYNWKPVLNKSFGKKKKHFGSATNSLEASFGPVPLKRLPIEVINRTKTIEIDCTKNIEYQLYHALKNKMENIKSIEFEC